MGPDSDRRSTPRRRVLKTAYIVLSDKAPKLECAVRNVSAKGACLELSTTYGIPARFDVVIDGLRQPCRAIWKTCKRVGVEFV
jgi:hypothetical protein